MPPNPKRRRMSSGVDSAKDDRVDKHQQQFSSEDDADASHLQFGRQVARQISQLSPNRFDFAIEKINELLRSLACSVTSLPDLVLVQILSECHSIKDIISFGATTPRLRRLVNERRVWWRYQRMRVVWNTERTRSWSEEDDEIERPPCVLIRRDGNDHLFDRIEIPARDQINVRQALCWAFNVCRPVQLYLKARIWRESVADLQLIADTLPPKDDVLPQSVKRLHLDLFVSTSIDDKQNVNALRQLIQKMPTQLTYLQLHKGVSGTGIGPILGRWLRDCTQLETFHCDVKRMTQLSILAALKNHPKLTTLAFNRMVDLVNLNTAATVRHLCLGRTQNEAHSTTLLNERARENVNSLCCVDVERRYAHIVKFANLPRLFPNCRRISTSIRGRDLSDDDLEKFCRRYRKKHSTEDKPEKLRLTLYGVAVDEPIRTSPAPDVVEVVQGEGWECCEVERLFFC